MVQRSLSEIKGIGPSMVKRLNKSNIYTVEDLANQSSRDLCRIDGIGSKSAKNWISQAKAFLGEFQEHETTQPTLTHTSDKRFENSLNKLHLDIGSIIKRLEKIEQRLDELEKRDLGTSAKSIKGDKLIDSISDHPFIRNENILLEVLKEKIREMTEKWLGIREVSIEDVYQQIIKDYSISKEIFAEYLLMLFQSKKILLKSSPIESVFSVRDNHGNLFQVVRILE